MYTILKHFAAIAAYLAAAQFAQFLAPQPGLVAPVWPSAGVGFAAIYTLGPVAALSMLCADMTASLLTGRALGTAMALGLCNVLALFLGVLLTKRTMQGQNPFGNAASMGHYLMGGPLLAALLAALGGVYLLELKAPLAAGLGPAIWSWFLSDFTGIVMLAPLTKAWRNHPLGIPPLLRSPEGGLLLLCAAVVSWGVFGLRHGMPLNLYPLIFSFIPVMAWATFRADSRTLTLLLTLVFIVAVTSTHFGLGPFGQHPSPLSHHLLQVFYSVTVVTTLIIHALHKERRLAMAALKASEEELRLAKNELEIHVEERTRKLHNALEELRDAEETYHTLFENASEGIYRTDASGRLSRANPGLASMLGYDSPEDLKEKITDAWRQIFCGEKERIRLYETLARSGQATGFEMQLRKRNGAPIWVSMSVRPVVDGEGRILGTEGIVQDITQRKLSEEELQRRATLDPLTGVANRHTFDRTFRRMLAQAERSGSGLALLFIDLDNFKQINDSHGHMAGDALLQTVSERIQSRLRESDLLARLGGDEFALLLHNVGDAANAERIAQEILAALARPMQLEDAELVIGASIGGSIYPACGTTTEELLRCADRAMYRAKQQGKNRSAIETS